MFSPKLISLLTVFLITTNVKAADFVIEVKPAVNSVSDPEVSALSISKILNLQSSLDSKAASSSLGTLSTKSTITNSEVADGALSVSKIANFASQVVSAMSSSITALQNSLDLKADKSQIPESYRNLIINGNFSVNQRDYQSGQVIAPNTYSHDRWKNGSSNSSHTFVSNPSGQEVNLSGNFSQVIEGKNLMGGTYVLSWSGTATARVNVNSTATSSGAWLSSPIVITGQNAGQEMNVQFQNGTVSKVQLNKGEIPAPFENRLYGDELRLAQRYYWREYASYMALDGYCPTAGGYLVVGSWRHPVPMRTSPTITLPNFTTMGNVNAPVLNGSTPDGYSFYAICHTVGRMILGGANSHMSASAEY